MKDEAARAAIPEPDPLAAVALAELLRNWRQRVQTRGVDSQPSEQELAAFIVRTLSARGTG